MKKLIFGCGYLGKRVAQAWLAQGNQVLAVTRSAARAEEFADWGVRPIVGDITADVDLRDADGVETVLFAVGLDRGSGQEIREVYVGGLQKVLDKLPAGVSRFIYISSTGVYGQADGEWVDEDSPCEPEREGGRACLAAETLLQTHEIGRRAVILRLAGIYGPGRLPKWKDIVAGNPIDSPADGYLNLIHVNDAVSAILAAEGLTSLPDRIIVSDGNPVLRGDFYRELAKLSGAPAPRFAEPADAGRSNRRGSTDKRIDNSRMRQRLAITLEYPTFCEGLAKIVAAEPTDSGPP
jgi:nucleoside-diphosphate-sugar epimerase